jgi:hypothetical protein
LTPKAFGVDVVVQDEIQLLRRHSRNRRKHLGNPQLQPPHRRPQPGNGRKQPGFDGNHSKIKVLLNRRETFQCEFAHAENQNATFATPLRASAGQNTDAAFQVRVKNFSEHS